MGRLLGWRGALPQQTPAVTIIVPAKDEEAGIRRCLEAILAQDYPRFDVIAIDDRSVDRTGAILDELAADHPQLRVIHIQPGALPAGWLGKCHALHLGTQQATGEWLFFVDSDVALSPHALKTALSIAIARKYDAVSILTRLECRSALERLMLPVLAGAWAVMHTISLTNDDARKDIAAANGQFFLIRRAAYDCVGGHESVKGQITEDVELMRRLKSQEFKTRFFMGSPLASTRMHSTLHQMFNGWARIYSGTARRRAWRILSAIGFIIVALFSVYPALGLGLHRAMSGGGAAWLIAGTLHLLLMTLYLALLYHWSGNPMRHALSAPASGSLLLAILIYSLRKCQTGRITWRDTEFVSRSDTPASPLASNYPSPNSSKRLRS